MSARSDKTSSGASRQESSAGVCSTCGRHVEKRYGGEGRYLPECIDCWMAGWAEEVAVSRAVEELRYAE